MSKNNKKLYCKKCKEETIHVFDTTIFFEYYHCEKCELGYIRKENVEYHTSKSPFVSKAETEDIAKDIGVKIRFKSEEEKEIEEMKKVKVSKEVAEILDYIAIGSLDTAYQRLGEALYDHNAFTEPSLYKTLKSHGEDGELFSALKFGYEVEKTPEEVILDEYNRAIEDATGNDYDSKFTGQATVDAIEMVLDELGIIINGINEPIDKLTNKEKYGINY